MKKTAAFTLLKLIIPISIFGQSNQELINNINTRLQSGQSTVSEILCDTLNMPLHSNTTFRGVIKSNAKTGKLRMVSETEPGTPITVKGTVTDLNGTPLKNLLVYVYQTSDKGWYSDTAAHILIREGDMRHARLFAYFKTDEQGKFLYETIKPKGYPKSDLAAHIHIAFWSSGNKPLRGPGELQFDDDERMTPQRRKRSHEEGFLIEKNSGTKQRPVYEYRIMLKE